MDQYEWVRTAHRVYKKSTRLAGRSTPYVPRPVNPFRRRSGAPSSRAQDNVLAHAPPATRPSSLLPSGPAYCRPRFRDRLSPVYRGPIV